MQTHHTLGKETKPWGRKYSERSKWIFSLFFFGPVGLLLWFIYRKFHPAEKEIGVTLKPIPVKVLAIITLIGLLIVGISAYIAASR